MTYLLMREGFTIVSFFEDAAICKRDNEYYFCIACARTESVREFKCEESIATKAMSLYIKKGRLDLNMFDGPIMLPKKENKRDVAPIEFIPFKLSLDNVDMFMRF